MRNNKDSKDTKDEDEVDTTITDKHDWDSGPIDVSAANILMHIPDRALHHTNDNFHLFSDYLRKLTFTEFLCTLLSDMVRVAAVTHGGPISSVRNPPNHDLWTHILLDEANPHESHPTRSEFAKNVSSLCSLHRSSQVEVARIRAQDSYLERENQVSEN